MHVALGRMADIFSSPHKFFQHALCPCMELATGQPLSTLLLHGRIPLGGPEIVSHEIFVPFFDMSPLDSPTTNFLWNPESLGLLVLGNEQTYPNPQEKSK